MNIADYLLTQSDAQHLRARLNARGEKLVMTNGVFDLLHVGHLDYLEKARQCGDALLVALNDDASTRRHKGRGRPLVPDAERARLVAALQPVTAVMLFSDDTADNILQAIQPHIYVKGGDYTPQTLPEYDTVQAYGGEVRFIEYLPQHSTTRLITRIQALPMNIASPPAHASDDTASAANDDADE